MLNLNKSGKKGVSSDFVSMNSGLWRVVRGGSGAPERGRPACVKNVYNNCGLACVLGLTSSNRQVSMTLIERTPLSPGVFPFWFVPLSLASSKRTPF